MRLDEFDIVPIFMFELLTVHSTNHVPNENVALSNVLLVRRVVIIKVPVGELHLEGVVGNNLALVVYLRIWLKFVAAQQ
jgi:hypothetical protein